MRLVSYAQNNEDIMLWRIFQNVENGFYIDVGANDPESDSVTKLFYDNGWQGINIEPLHAHYMDLQTARPRDINLQVAAGEFTGELELWECSVRGWATTNKTVIERHISAGQTGVFHRVPVSRLADICEKYTTKEIHFLKIDVEGSEKLVLKGMDFKLFRPWVLIVEATLPNSNIEVYEEWESILHTSNYCFAYSDGINRYYLAEEHIRLKPLLLYPPNVLDNFIVVAQLSMEKRAMGAEKKIAYMEKQVLDAEENVLNTEKQLETMHNSRSWRFTFPLRKIAGFVRKIKNILRGIR